MTESSAAVFTPEHKELNEVLHDIADERGEINRKKLGWWMKRHVGRIVDGRRFVRASGNRSAEAWTVESDSPVLRVLSSPSRQTVARSGIRAYGSSGAGPDACLTNFANVLGSPYDFVQLESIVNGAGWGRKRNGTFVEDCLCLDIVLLRKRGFLDHAGSVKRSWGWTRPNGQVVRAELDVMMLNDVHGPRILLHIPGLLKPGVKDQLIYLDRTQPNFGGTRWWFMCLTGERCGKLYLAPGEQYFMSRAALGLDYLSQHLNHIQRRQLRAQRLREQLERSESSASISGKPKGMWNKTFESKMRRIRNLEDQAERALRECLLRSHGMAMKRLTAS